MKKLLSLMFVFGLLSSGAIASSPVSKLLPQAELVGQTRYSYLFWDVYDIALYAPDGNWQGANPLALTLTYLREFEGEKIAERSIKEMRKQGLNDEALAQQWLDDMRSIFPDVDEQQSLTGVWDEQGTTHFFYNGEAIGSVSDPEFGRWFFNIWLGRETSEPDLREALLQGGNS